MYEWNDKLHEECGVFGVWSLNKNDVRGQSQLS